MGFLFTERASFLRWRDPDSEVYGNYHHLTPPPKEMRSPGTLCPVVFCKKCSLIAMTKSLSLFSLFCCQFTEELKICASIINMFVLIPAASSRLIESLISLVLKVEKVLLVEVSCDNNLILILIIVKFFVLSPGRLNSMEV